jgi:hypothetical protein
VRQRGESENLADLHDIDVAWLVPLSGCAKCSDDLAVARSDRRDALKTSAPGPGVTVRPSPRFGDEIEARFAVVISDRPRGAG